jgi:hypothetical protein
MSVKERNTREICVKCDEEYDCMTAPLVILLVSLLVRCQCKRQCGRREEADVRKWEDKRVKVDGSGGGGVTLILLKKDIGARTMKHRQANRACDSPQTAFFYEMSNKYTLILAFIGRGLNR